MSSETSLLLGRVMRSSAVCVYAWASTQVGDKAFTLGVNEGLDYDTLSCHPSSSKVSLRTFSCMT